MAESRCYALDAQLVIQQILVEAEHRWLRPTEICAILQNHTKFRIGPEPPCRPPSGSLFLFDRKVLRYFRKDGHSWRRKKDGKTVKEAHERLKAGSVDVLHCYYAHGEDNGNFQRRSYWMLKEDLSHIVLVHYLEVKGNRVNFNIREAGVIRDSRQSTEDISNSGINSSAASKFQSYDDRGATHVTDRTSLNSTQASEYEDVESAYRHQASPWFQSINKLQSPGTRQVEVASVSYYPVPISNNHCDQFSVIPSGSFGLTSQGEKDKIPMDNGFTYEIPRDTEFPPREKVVESSIDGHELITFHPSLPSPQSSAVNMMFGQEELMGQVSGSLGKIEEFGSHFNGLEEWQASECDTDISKWSFDQKSDNYRNLVEKTNYPPLRQPLWYDLTTEVEDVSQVLSGDSVGLHSAYTTEQSGHLITNDFQMQTSSAGANHLKSESTTVVDVEDKLRSVSREGLRKLDSFDRWMNKELGDVTESNMQNGSEPYWDTVGNGDGLYDSGISTQVPLDNYVLSPILSQDQFFTILDFSPTWAYSGSETKVLVMGKFLMGQEEVEKHKWACMFGELEVPAEIVANGVFRCYTPLHETGRVPFYVTCSNRLACSEVWDFDFRTSAVQDEDLAEVGNISSDETLLHMRFGKLLSLEPVTPQNYAQSDAAETSRLCSKISALLKDDTEWEQMLNLSKQDEFSADKVKDQLLQKFLKEKLHVWLLQKVTEGGKGPSVLDEGGQGVLHFAAALGYDWAIPPTIAAGVNVNFRDVNGWTALHWAAYYGRERTVAFLISLGAAPGAVTDPTLKYPLGRPPADLASTNGHKGISGYLAESELSSHLKSLDLKDSNESNIRENAVETVSERTTLVCNGDLPHGLSLKDSLAALRNATQAAARIHQVYRVQSFQRKQFKEYGDSEFGMSDERALSLIGLKSKKAGPRDEPVYAAATRIQNKFRSWKDRKEFLLTRQRIIKIQAHVRGHQVRKSYKNITWSVGILDKVILRWRRKGRGLSGFKPESIAAAGTSMQDTDETKEDDYDFLKQGRQQTEERLQKALARVKSMVQYPEARDQYRRLLNVVSEMQETKATNDNVLSNPEMDFHVDLIDFAALFEDDTFMLTAL